MQKSKIKNKKLGHITIISLLLVVSCLLLVNYGCGQQETAATTTTTACSTTTTTTGATTTTTTSTTSTSTSTTTTSTTSTTTPTAQGVRIGGIATGLGSQAQYVKSQLILALASSEGNPDYTDAYASPLSYEVSVFKCSMLTNESAVDSYVVFDFGGVDSAEAFSLNESHSRLFGSNEAYPDSGTYTHIAVDLVYLEMAFPMDLGDVDNTGYTNHRGRLYCSTVTDPQTASEEIQDGDVLIEVNGVWNWINTNNGSFSSTRPSNLVQDTFFSTAASADPYHDVITLETPVIVPQNPQGLYAGTLSFNTANTFFFDDVDNDEKFKPGVPSPNGDYVVGPSRPDWSPRPPVITCTFEVQQ